jgi:mRNA interferase MazF
MRADNREAEEKRFPEWMECKEHIHNVGRLSAIKEREVWWVAVGENVGVEINGKSGRFSRPVLIYKKLSKFGFLGIPLTSQEHGGSWYVPFDFQGETSYATLAQIRVMSVSQLYGNVIGRISKADFRAICKGFDNLYHFDFDDLAEK